MYLSISMWDQMPNQIESIQLVTPQIGLELCSLVFRLGLQYRHYFQQFLAQKPHPCPHPSPVLPTPNFLSPLHLSSPPPLQTHMPLLSTFDKYPSLSWAINSLPYKERELAISNVICMTMEQRKGEDSWYQLEYILSWLSLEQYNLLFSGFESDNIFSTAATQHQPQPEHQPQPQPQSHFDAGHLVSPQQVWITFKATTSKPRNDEVNIIPMFKPEECRMPPWVQSWNEVFPGLQCASNA